MAALVLLAFATASEVVAQSSNKVYRVIASPKTSDGDGQSWADSSAMSLTAALAVAQAGDEIWVKRGEYKAPAGGFRLNSGVKLYGGLAGTETTHAQAASPACNSQKFDLANKTFLIGDTNGDDAADAVRLVYPENATRDDNSRHVVVMNLGVSDSHRNDNSEKTVLQGFVIRGGNASGSSSSADGHGGGVLVTNSSSSAQDANASQRGYDILQCFFFGNYGARGGALYVDPSVVSGKAVSHVGYCCFFNNVAGGRGQNVNCGAAMWIGGAGTVSNTLIYNNTGGGVRISDRAKLVNCTVAHNTVTAVDLVDAATVGKPGSDGGGALYNCVMWGSSTLCKTETYPQFYYCAFPEVTVTDKATGTDSYHNRYISYTNFTRTEAAAWFDTPSSSVGYDISYALDSYSIPQYSFEFDEQSALTEAGNAEYYRTYVASSLGDATDLGGHARLGGSGIDIGAYEREVLAAGRRLYVSANGNDGNDGLSWSRPLADIQTAIDKLAEQSGKGEVWVSQGVYSPKKYIVSGDQKSPLAFRMRDGISVYGGFRGRDAAAGYAGEQKLSERERGEYPWDFKYVTILRGDKFDPVRAVWNASDESWSVSSDSYHVVWFAPLPDGREFVLPTVLNGVTVEGGAASAAADTLYSPYSGTGIYMAGNYPQVRNCIVRYNNAGMKTQALNGKMFTPQGGGIYCQGGQVRYSLVYNNSAEHGGGVYLSTMGFVNNSMIANNSGANGSGVYLWQDPSWGEYLDYSQILATSVITNNQSTRNGAVYVSGSGLVEQNTIANNYTSNVTDLSDPTNTSRTAGIYVTRSCIAVNNILWNNTLQQNMVTSKKTSSSLAPIYAASPKRDSVMFYNNAMSDVNAATWNNIYQTGTYELTSLEFRLGAEDGQYASASDFSSLNGVQSEWKTIDYMWPTRSGSALRNKGILYGQLSALLLFKPSTDFLEHNFEAQPPVGAYVSSSPSFVFDNTTKPGVLRLYHDYSGSVPSGNGSSWLANGSVINEMLEYVSTLSVGDKVSVVGATGGTRSYTIQPTDRFEICTREGKIQPSRPYTFQENDAKSRSVQVEATSLPLTIRGGYPAYATKANPTEADWLPKTYRTEFTGNAAGTELSDGLYHVFRVEAGANLTLEGLAITDGYAAGTAYVPYGGAMLIGSLYSVDRPTQITMRRCVMENNTAVYGAAIGAMSDTRRVSVTLENCVVNNNSCLNEKLSDVEGGSTLHAPLRATASNATANSAQGRIFELGDDSNTLTLRHVTIVNNVGIVPETIGSTSFAAGNMTYDATDNLTATGANNTLTVATLDAKGAANFANPTKDVGSRINGNVYYGGYADFRPLTSSLENDAIINQVVSDDSGLSRDIDDYDRDLGGAPDLGAYEALLPKAGKVIYVRSYNTVWKQDDSIDGTPDFNLINNTPTAIYDGSTWSRAIMGNAVCDTLSERSGNDFYVRDQNGRLLAATLDNTLYGADYNAATVPYGQTSNYCYSFFMGGTSGGTNGNRSSVWSSAGYSYNQITNDRKERYISGLQYAVEQAARWNREHPGGDSVVVWVGAGVYTDSKGFVIRDGVKVYGGFCRNGNPGEDDRRPLLSQYVPARKGYESLNKTDYETILQVRKETPVYMTKNTKELWWSEGKPSDGSYYDYFDKMVKSGKTERHSVLYQPDVCLPTWGVSGDGLGTRIGANQYRYPGFGNCDDNTYYQEYRGVKWDGFSIRHGYITNYEANRDGGAGVRVFRGIRLENLIIVNNACHGRRSRGGGLYMDGDNSVISNSFLLQNLVWGSADCYGGGAYMIQGVGYNMVVASNRSLSQGGGIFIESAKFYNNTVAYNMANNVQGTGIMHWQDNTTGISSQLTLYNCIVYDNMRNGGVTSGITQIGSSSPGKFRQSYNCYVNSGMGNLSNVFKAEDGNVTGTNIAFPFAVKGYGDNGTESSSDVRRRTARLTNDFRLNEADGLTGNPCLNGGTENMPSIPATDMDYTNRIKDCTIDIGAYEADNTANIQPQTRTRKKTVTVTTATGGTQTKEIDETYYVYYVTQTGAGNRSGSDPDNAACADKLQSVLTAAGQLAYANDFQYKVYVKAAGYQTDDDGERFVYHANTLADPSDPQSYTYLIPEGVWLMGGYNEGTTVNGKYDPKTYNWDDDARDVITDYQTVLSARTEPKEGSTVTQEVYGYHVVSFGKWPKGDADDYYKHAIPGKTVNGKLVNGTAGIDGVRLIDGRATDNSGFSGKGGGAVVPAYAHVRNCVITDCEAIDGGALYVMPGSFVSGCLMHSNTAQNGGAIYASGGYQEDPRTQTYRAYVASCTIAGNTATTGGGISQETGAVFVGNTVIWGNTASVDKNISGIVNETFNDNIHHVPGDTTIVDYFPYNACFVERYNLPGNITNTEMTSDLETYFASTGEYYPRPYSPLIDNGIPKSYFLLWRQLGAAAYDLKGVARGAKDRLTVGAYAMTLPEVDSKTLLKRLFVSTEGGAEVSEELKAKYVGRSFYTPFNSLDAALSYIKQARKTGLASDTTHFDILIAGGTYRPSIAREDKDIVEGQVVIDRRLQSFVIPVDVNIYGSFFNTDRYSSNPVGSSPEESLESITDVLGNTYDLTPDENIKKILAERNRDHMTDMNKNKLIEPWEFANPTILSGDIKASENEKRVYHVVYSRIDDDERTSADKNNDVLLDGITIMNGQTADEIDDEDDDAEPGISTVGDEKYNDIGHGGGIYSRNVSYTLNRCRVLRNVGVHGGGIYIYNGSLDLIGCAVSGNWAGSESESMGSGSGKGGGVCATFSESGMGNVHAVNSLFANNTAGSGSQHLGGGEGGAIYIKRLNQSDPSYRDLAVVNSLIVRNYAAGGPDVFLEPNISSESEASADNPLLINTVCWGNASTRNTRYMYLYDTQMSHCALDIRGRLDSDTKRATSSNITLDRENMTATGPRFTEPSTMAGNDGFTIGARWNPASISVLTDAGDGVLAKQYVNYDMSKATGAYRDWWALHDARLPQYGYPDEYITRATAEQSAAAQRGAEPYRRYMGPTDDYGNADDRKIDIGLYEFQYQITFPELEAVYIGTEEHGDGDGRDWNNQSTDLRGAIIAMSNPIGNSSTGTATQGVRRVYVRDGEYYAPALTGGDAFSLIVNTGEKANLVTGVEIVGACTGKTIGEGSKAYEEQDFSKQTVLVPNPLLDTETELANLLNITANGRPVTVSGLTFRNNHASTSGGGGHGITAKLNNTAAFKEASLTLKNCAFRDNLASAMRITANDGKVLIYNTLFADGKANALEAAGRTTVVNATFAQNAGADYVTADGGSTSVYNSVAWENSKQNLVTAESLGNRAFTAGQANDDVMAGPNFADPAAGDYTLRPSLALLNQGKNQWYVREVGVAESSLTADSTTVCDLANQRRVTGGAIDIGAYECDSKLLPIIYVKTDLAASGTGESWASPTNSVQSAVNLAELYANTSPNSKSAYVFVDRNATASGLNITLPGVKVYGSMNNETASADYANSSDLPASQIKAIVDELLSKRRGVIEQASQSTVDGLTMDYTAGTAGSAQSSEPSVVDGFMLKGMADVKNGYVSTSIVDGSASVSGSADATLYNSLVFGTVADVKTVNVTSTAALPTVGGSANNRSAATEKNRYVSADYWNWQLNEKSADIDGGDAASTEACIKAVGHRRDLAGNLRLGEGPDGLRPFDTKVDNGCFETWHLTQTYTVSPQDYPHGRSVIYVDGERSVPGTVGEYEFFELRLPQDTLYTKSSPFSPGFLLLGHHAGLRGNGNEISLGGFGVERRLMTGNFDMCVMPFAVAARELYVDGKLQSDVSTNDSRAKNYYSEYSYSGSTRAAYDYTYDSTDSRAWTDGSLAGLHRTDGFMIKVDAENATADTDIRLRFYGNSYTESASGAAVTLTQYNNQQAWADQGSDGMKFTHKENMGWNLFGSPYLCAMNYSDMQYPRMVYVNRTMYDGTYLPVNTEKTSGGYVPAFDALFTQTATLRSEEQFRVGHSAELEGSPYEESPALSLMLSAADGGTPSRSAEAGGASGADELLFNAVDSADARDYFDMSLDGVKWMLPGRPQIYAVSGASRYSLLSDVSRDGELKVGLDVPEDGIYNICIPESADISDYEAVTLKDALTGTSADLLSGGYVFRAEKGASDSRFSVVFRKAGAQASGIAVSRIGENRIRVTGLQPGDDVRVYAADGKIANAARAVSESLALTTGGTAGACIVTVVRNGQQVCVKKMMN